MLGSHTLAQFNTLSYDNSFEPCHMSDLIQGTDYTATQIQGFLEKIETTPLVQKM